MIEIYTDGGCSNNGADDAVGAVGVVAVQHEKILFEHSQTYLGTTNNRMEYRAMVFAMNICVCNKIEEVTFYSDSNLLVQTINLWMYSWQKNNWKKKTSPKEIKNLDLVLQLWELKLNLEQARFLWVKAHAGNLYNERADELATSYNFQNAERDEINTSILNRYI